MTLPPAHSPWRGPRALLWLAAASALHGAAFLVSSRPGSYDFDRLPPLVPQTIELAPSETTAETGASSFLPAVGESKPPNLRRATREKALPEPLGTAVHAPESSVSPTGTEAPWSAQMLRPSQPEGITRLGLGVGGTAGSGFNPNLSLSSLREIIDPTEIANLARKEEAQRLASHRQSWKAAGVERWRAATEAYVPRVRLGNQVAIGASHAAFAAFLRAMAARIRPVFLDGFVTWILALPPGHALRQPHLQTRLEIVLEGGTGSIARTGVVLTSGVTAFDVGALDAVQRAAPFGEAPAEIRSPDGRVYVQWDLRGDPASGFSDQDARPSILREAPQIAK